jgi:hypothetical protein
MRYRYGSVGEGVESDSGIRICRWDSSSEGDQRSEGPEGICAEEEVRESSRVGAEECSEELQSMGADEGFVGRGGRGCGEEKCDGLREGSVRERLEELRWGGGVEQRRDGWGEVDGEGGADVGDRRRMGEVDGEAKASCVVKKEEEDMLFRLRVHFTALH